MARERVYLGNAGCLAAASGVDRKQIRQRRVHALVTGKARHVSLMSTKPFFISAASDKNFVHEKCVYCHGVFLGGCVWLGVYKGEKRLSAEHRSRIVGVIVRAALLLLVCVEESGEDVVAARRCVLASEDGPFREGRRRTFAYEDA